MGKEGIIITIIIINNKEGIIITMLGKEGIICVPRNVSSFARAFG